MSRHGHSEACCTVPPAQANYKETGEYVEIGGMRTYRTGPKTADTAILFVFDIFGFFPQTLQGADILAHTADEHHQFQVFMPDWFNGKPAEVSWYPPDNEEKLKSLNTFLSDIGSPKKAIEKIPSVVNEIVEKSGGTIKKFGVIGLCWGAKISILTAQSNKIFGAIAMAHPSMIDPNDAKAIEVPVCVLASKDEDAEAVKKFGEELKVESHVEIFADQVHGWMGARGLENEKGTKEYERGYQIVLDFFHKHL